MASRLAALVLTAAALSSPAFARNSFNPTDPSALEQRQKLASYGHAVAIELDGQGVPSSLMGPLSNRTFGDPHAAAQEALEVNGPAFRRGATDGFAVRTEEADTLGLTHVRMTQLYNGIPVVGGELIVHMGADRIVGINGRFVADLDLSTRPAIGGPQAAGYALESVARDGGDIANVIEIAQPVIFPNGENEGRLAIPVKILYSFNGEPKMDDIYVDAENGRILGHLPRVYTAKFRKVYDGAQSCTTLPGTLLFQEGGSSSDTAATGAYNGTGTTYDFYKGVFNRDSFDNLGANIVSTVHFQFSNGTSCSKDNAAWFDAPDNQMAYGDGTLPTFSNLANGLDVTAHELSHAVTSRTANLAYQFDSGALNEGNSDIMGRSTAFWSGQGNVATKTDWSIGADVYTPATPGDALRYMYDPFKDGSSADYWPTRNYASGCTPSNANDQCGVHTNSGIANLFYYLISQGGTHPRGKTTVSVPAIGITNARQIWYRALTVYMTSSTNYAGARTATAQAAADLFGGSCSATWQAVQKGWDAVGVSGTWTCGGPATFPESAHPYANSINQSFTYTLAGAPSSINVTFDAQTSVENTYDFIYITDKNGVAISGSPFTGTTLAGVTKSVSGDTVNIRLTSDASVTAYGFRVSNVVAGGTVVDTTPPTVSISSPASGATISGATTVSATAADNIGVAKVEFYLDGALQATDTTSPYSWSWAPTSAQNGSHSLTAKAYDAANNSTTSSAVSVTVSISTTCAPAQVVGNPGFESGAVTWTTSAGVIDNSTGRPSHAGAWKAWMNGYAAVHTDSVTQNVTIPACATTATFSFWIRIDTAETGSGTYDTLTVAVKNTSGGLLQSLATYSNLNATSTYVQKSFNLAAFKGQTIQLSFVGVEDSSLQTSFVIDDVALNTN